MAESRKKTTTRRTKPDKPDKPEGWDRIGGVVYADGAGKPIGREEFLKRQGRDPYDQKDPYTLWCLEEAKRRPKPSSSSVEES